MADSDKSIEVVILNDGVFVNGKIHNEGDKAVLTERKEKSKGVDGVISTATITVAQQLSKANMRRLGAVKPEQPSNR